MDKNEILLSQGAEAVIEYLIRRKYLSQISLAENVLSKNVLRKSIVSPSSIRNSQNQESSTKVETSQEHIRVVSILQVFSS
jgi:hypothetical protein